MFKKFIFLSLISFTAFSYGNADPISVDVVNLSTKRLPGITFSIDRKIETQKGKQDNQNQVFRLRLCCW